MARVARRLAVVLLLVGVAAAAFALTRYWDFVLTPPWSARYQAVFLANGQTYFGHYLERLGPYVKVENAFYIQQQPAQTDQQPADARIIRRGSELHQPYAYVLIPKDAILFVEDLRPDSQVGQFMDKELAK